ncbi:MAG TPA: biotin/lipoyl-containing protein, partial [Candidatus Nitrosotenuis sp.]|nr:biotin/lipoyl-containing protein [Candidatus Nitrosotenuis sp.]
RLQVEHPVTEEITGLDLVEWQLRVAEGQPLPLRQEQIRFSGHAVEVRLYAEDPRHEFLPSTGPVRIWRTPSGARVDSGIDQGDRVGTHYDPLLAKILCSGAGRPQALARLARALEETVLLGLTSNLDFLRELVSHPELAEGRTDTGFLERHRLDGGSRDSSSALLCAALAEWLDRPLPDWARGHWRNNPDGQPYLYRFETAEGQEVEVDLLPPLERGGGGTGPWQVMGRPVRLLERRGPDLALEVEGRRLEAVLVREGPHWWVQTEGRVARLGRRPLLPEPRAGAEAAGSLRAPMPGVVVAVLVEVGQRVEAGQPLLKLEAMKMEHTVAAAFPGRVEALPLRPGDRVQADDLLVVLSPDPVPPTPV